MTLRVWCLLCVLAVTMTAVYGGDYDHTIYVDSEGGHNSTACLNSPSPSHPCRNLSFALQYRNSSTHYLLQAGTHYLNSTVSFTNLHDIAITGNSSVGKVIIVCNVNSGLSFINTEIITFGNLKLTHGSSKYNSTSWNWTLKNFQLLYIRSALYFSHCRAISMYQVSIFNSTDANAITVYNTIGRNNFTKCVFSNNRVSSDSRSDGGGGGGVYIEFSYCLPGNTDCENGTEVSYTNYNHDSMYIFTGCLFSNNHAYLSAITRTVVIEKQHHVAFGEGGGLSIFFCGNATNNSIVITNCTFRENTALIGGGLFVQFTDSSVGNSLTVTGTECTFFNNTGTGDEGGGGGMHLGHILFDKTHNYSKGNSAHISNCNFSRNSATHGGGLQITSSRQEWNSTKFTLLITGVLFESNQGRYGAGLGLFLLDFILKSYYPDITIHNCHVHNNKVYHNHSRPYKVGMGAVYISELEVNFCGTNDFRSNFGTALAVASAAVSIMDSYMYFSNNKGVKGGAIALLESARLLVNDNTSVYFSNNTAFLVGGAIYRKNSNQAEVNICFVMHQIFSLDPEKWNAKFIFEDNFDSGSLSQNAIFATSIIPCAFTSIEKVFCWKHWFYYYHGVRDYNCSKFIRTAPGNVTIIDDNEKMEIATVHAYPGEVIQLPIVVQDDLHHSLQTVFTVDGHDEHAMVDKNYTYVWNNSIRVLGTGGDSLKVYLNNVGDREWQITFRVNLTKCPPGLLPITTPQTDNCNTSTSGHDGCRTSSSCECNPQKNFVELVQCNTATSASFASGYWMGRWMAADGEEWYVVSSCPSGFCRTARTEFIPLPRKNLDEHICGVHKRTGRVCGKCIEGHGPALNSEVYMCVPCRVSKTQLIMHVIYYILAVYVPLFLLFVAIVGFNIKLTTGPANAFILYSQVISSTMNLIADGRLSLDSITPHIYIFLKAYKFPYGIFNLEFFENFIPPRYMCLGTHLNVLDIFLLDYLVAFFPLMMVIAITILYRIADYCPVCYTIFPRCKRGLLESFRNALLPAFASFILLSYTKFSLTTSYIISMVAQRNASGHYVLPLHVNFAAQYAYNDTEYIVRYLLPASFVFIVFVVIPPLILLDFPLQLFEKLLKMFPHIWRYYPYDKVHIMLDTFQSCYKNRWRSFAGVYFLFRLMINITNAICDDLGQFILQEIYCIIFALLIAFFKPYKRKYNFLNYVDSLIFLNLAMINLITLFLYADTRKGTKPSIFAFSIQYILVFIPLLYMLSYVAWRVPPIRSRVRKWLAIRQHSQQVENMIHDVTSESTDDAYWERAEATNCYNPSSMCTNQAQHKSTPAPNNVHSSRTKHRRRRRRRGYGSIHSSINASFDFTCTEDDR